MDAPSSQQEIRVTKISHRATAVLFERETDGKEEAQRDRSPGVSLCPSTSMFSKPLQTRFTYNAAEAQRDACINAERSRLK
jgi:hypothetical protein